MSLDPKRTVAELKELRALTADENGAQRVAWTDTWLKARQWFQSKLDGLPVEHHHDAAGNSWVTLAATPRKRCCWAATWTPCRTADGLTAAWA